MEWKEIVSLAGAFISAAVALLSLWWQKRQERLAINRAVLGEISRLNEVQKTRSQYAKAEDFEALYSHNLDVVADTYYQHFNDELLEHGIKRPDEQPIVGGLPPRPTR